MSESSDEVWTIKGCLDWTVGYLERRGDEHPRVSAEWLLSAALDVQRIYLYMNYDRPLSLDERAVMRDSVKRRAKGEPLQYVTGETSFRGHDFWCEPGVLIPRPETELLTDMVLHYLDDRLPDASRSGHVRAALPWNEEVESARRAELARMRADSDAEAPDGDGADGTDASDALPSERDSAPAGTLRVLEVGCGTGCISISLALERAGLVSCVATDIDEAPANLARRNRARHGLDERSVDIRQGDLVEPVRRGEYGTFDVLVSNPPYIPSDVVDRLDHEVRDYEPRLALDGGADGLAVYRRLVEVAPSMLRSGGLFACELFEGAVDQAAALCRGAGMVDVRIVEDLAHHPRFVFAEMPSNS